MPGNHKYQPPKVAEGITSGAMKRDNSLGFNPHILRFFLSSTPRAASHTTEVGTLEVGVLKKQA